MTVKFTVEDKLANNTLDLSCWDLEDVPVKEIAAVKKGTHLDLSNNQLVRLPETFITLTHIVKLDLSKNLLEELPENIGEMRQLQHLDLYDNEISRLPLSFGELKNLKWLDLKDNPLTEVLSLLAGPCGDRQQCQNCALLVVSYYSDIKQSIAEKKEIAMQAAAAKERKREAKRRKKKRRNAEKNSINNLNKKDKEDSESEELILSEELNTETLESDDHYVDYLSSRDAPDSLCKTSGVFCNSLTRWIINFITWFFHLAVMCLIAFTILPKIDKERSEMLIRHAQEITGLPFEEYQQYCVKKFDNLVLYVSYLTNYMTILINDTYHRHFGEEPVDADDADL